MEVIEAEIVPEVAGPPSAIGATEARELTQQIRLGLETAYVNIIAAYRGRAWQALGYTSWDSYCTGEFGNLALRPPREDREEVIHSMRDAGMSVRAIGTATGLGLATVHRGITEGGVPGGTPDRTGEGTNPLDSSSQEGGEADSSPPRTMGLDGKSYSSSRVETEPEVSGQSSVEDVLDMDAAAIGITPISPTESEGRTRKARTQAVARLLQSPLPTVIRLAGEIALVPEELRTGDDLPSRDLETLATDTGRGILALANVLKNVDSTLISDMESKSVLSETLSDAVADLGAVLDMLHGGVSK